MSYSRFAHIHRSGTCWQFHRCAIRLLGVVSRVGLVFVLWNTLSAQAMTGGAPSSWLTSLGFEPKTPHPAVVRITAAERNSLAQGSGSLVAVSEQHGLVLTNWHVVRDAAGPVIVVFPDGFQSAAQILKLDEQWDLAALLIWRPRAAPMALASTAPRPGDVLTIAGYGSGNYRSASGRCTQYVAPGASMPYEMVEVSVAARQGDSGGPICNERGELAGVLFGSSRGTTSGSYCGRLRIFLQPLWPDVTQSGSMHTVSATATPTRELLDLPTPPATDDVPAAAGLPLANTADLSDQHEAPVSYPSPQPAETGLPLIDLSPPAPQPDWWRLAGQTPLEQAKTALAGIGLLVVLLRCSQWLSTGAAHKGVSH